MSTFSFKEFWNKHYPESIPLGHLLRLIYPERWFRIHSLPESKRYPDDEDEWKILLYRQNKLITDLLGKDNEVYLVTGRYFYLNPNISKVEKDYFELDCFSGLDLNESDSINLVERYPEDNDEEDGAHFVPASTIITWIPGIFDDILKKIANDEVHAMFVGITKRTIVSPYDGGADCIIENPDQVEYFNNKYQNWISRLESGL